MRGNGAEHCARQSSGHLTRVRGIDDDSPTIDCSNNRADSINLMQDDDVKSSHLKHIKRRRIIEDDNSSLEFPAEAVVGSTIESFSSVVETSKSQIDDNCDNEDDDGCIYIGTTIPKQSLSNVETMTSSHETADTRRISEVFSRLTRPSLNNNSNTFLNMNDKSPLLPNFPTTDNALWVDKYGPSAGLPLGVHKKKVAEVRSWILSSIQPYGFLQHRLLLLTGPCGSGKTATVCHLCKELNVELVEWTEKVDFSNISNSYTRDSRMEMLRSFLSLSSSFVPLSMSESSPSSGRLLLLEDLPNVIENGDKGLEKKLYSILDSYLHYGTCPVIIVASDEGPIALYTTILRDLQKSKIVSTIKFNTMAKTLLTNVLTNVCASASLSVSKADVAVLAEKSGGDVRHALNMLQLCCTGMTRNNITDTMKTNLKKRKITGIRNEFMNHMSCGGRDSSYDMFRSLGSILYWKQDDAAELPRTPEAVAEQSQLPPEPFSLFLFQNYLQFGNSIETCETVADLFAYSNTLLSRAWSHQESSLPLDIASDSVTFASTATSLFLRGALLLSTTSNQQSGDVSSPIRTFALLRKPVEYYAAKTVRSNAKTGRLWSIHGTSLCYGRHFSGLPVFLDMIPYECLLHRTSKRGKHLTLPIAAMSSYSSSGVSPLMHCPDEKWNPQQTSIPLDVFNADDVAADDGQQGRPRPQDDAARVELDVRLLTLRVLHDDDIE